MLRLTVENGRGTGLGGGVKSKASLRGFITGKEEQLAAVNRR